MAFKAQEQRRVVRREGDVEGALPAKHQDDGRYKEKNKTYQPRDGEGAHAITKTK